MSFTVLCVGKPYSKELALFPETYEWALDLNIETLIKAIKRSVYYNLITTGSGGSLSAAHLIAYFHQHLTGNFAKSVTPLELASTNLRNKSTAVFFLTASGKNTDIIGSFRRTVIQDPTQLLVVCARKASQLEEIASHFRFVDQFDFDVPAGKDGFLATNSLLAFSVLFCRAYETVLSKCSLPKSFASLVHPRTTLNAFIKHLEASMHPLWSRETLVVLHGAATSSAAIDLESKFTEAALGSVQIADYRNFAHGRHHWLAKRGNKSAVLALITNNEREIAEKTLKLIPSNIPVARLEVPHAGMHAALAALFQVAYLVGIAGPIRRIDPGRPGVPSFGSKIYRLQAFHKRSEAGVLNHEETIAIERKAGNDIQNLILRNELQFWREKYRVFTSKLRTTVFGGVVLDYDGTLCEPDARYEGIGNDIRDALMSLLRQGIHLGIATGRGKSVKSDLRKKIPPRYWPQIMVGYYNGGDIALLSEDAHPLVGLPCESLSTVLDGLKNDELLNRIAEIQPRQFQITVEAVIPIPKLKIWNIVQPIIQNSNVPGVTVVQSSHSVDILPSGITKCAVVAKVRALTQNNEVLCIGDRGQWPGNDFDLLSESIGLSVDEVSADPNTCWNLAPGGFRGPQACLFYLAESRVTSQGLRIRLKPRRL